MEQRISIERMEQAVNIFGSFDENVRLLEKEFSVAVTNRDGELRINGEPENVMHAAKAVQAMLTLSSRGEALGEQNVRYVIDMVRAGREEQISELAGDVLTVTLTAECREEIGETVPIYTANEPDGMSG